MGKVNNALCEYFATAEYFADFWNGTEFQYLKSLNKKQLVRMDKEYYKAGKKQKRDLRRDSVWRYEGKRRMILGMELLDSIDYTMPVRIMDYNVQEMKRQLKDLKSENREAVRCGAKKWKHKGEFLYKICKEDRILPVHTVGLYCGTGEYDGANDVLGMTAMEGMTEEEKGLFAPYPVHIYNIRQLEEDKFNTSLRELVAMTKRSENWQEMKQYYEEHKVHFHELDDTSIEAMGALLGREDLKEFKREEGGLDVCKAFDDVQEMGRIEGRAEGRAEMIERMMKKLKLTAEEVLEFLEIPMNERAELL